MAHEAAHDTQGQDLDENASALQLGPLSPAQRVRIEQISRPLIGPARPAGGRFVSSPAMASSCARHYPSGRGHLVSRNILATLGRQPCSRTALHGGASGMGGRQRCPFDTRFARLRHGQPV